MIMSNFYDMKDEIGFPGRWHLADPDCAEGCDASDFRTGRPVSLRTRPDAQVHTPGVMLDFTLTDLAVPIVSSRLARVIRELGDQTIQWIPLTVGGREGYEIINATRILTCLDEERSEFLKWTEADERPDRIGRYRMVSRLVIDPARVPVGSHVFRIWGWYVTLIVSQAVVEAAQQVGAVGVVFDKVA
jgi:hypothetical protein